MRIRIRCRANDHKHCNWLKWQNLSRMFQGNRWRVLRTGIGRSDSYADLPNSVRRMDKLTIEQLHQLRLRIFDKVESLHKEAKLLLDNDF